MRWDQIPYGQMFIADNGEGRGRMGVYFKTGNHYGKSLAVYIKSHGEEEERGVPGYYFEVNSPNYVFMSYQPIELTPGE